MTILLVDDETQLRNYLRTLVDWEGLGYKFLEADNGAAAVELMKKTPVNLLMLDITMPVMSGLEVLEWINENRYECVTAMLTSHDEFSYAQKALRLGCADYILKSDITGEAILSLAGRMRENLTEELRQQQHYAAMETAARRKEMIEVRDTVNYWLDNGNAGNHDICGYLEGKIGFADNGNKYVLVRILIHEYNAVINRYTDSDIIRFSVVFDGVLRELLDGCDFFYTECVPGEFLLFLRFKPDDAPHVPLSKARELTKRIDVSFSGLLGIHSSILYTLPYQGFESSLERYEKFKRLRDFSFWNPPEGIMCLEDFVFDEQTLQDALSKSAREFTRELESHDMLRIEIAYDKITDQIAKGRYCVSPAAFKNACVSCAAVFLLAQSREKADFSQMFLINDCAAFKAALLKLIRPHCISEKDRDKKVLVKKALLLIQQHYQEDIGLDWLASRLYVNASYLSRVFSAETDQPLTSYVNQYRIDEAKRLIRSENFKLYEVAEKTGFSSSIVFSNVFKKITGETPSEYKNRSV